MSQTESSLVPLPASVVDAVFQDIEKDAYAKNPDRPQLSPIQHQMEITLPYSVTELMGVALRDEGNRLLEETTILNNAHVGRTTRVVASLLYSDLELIDLKARAVNWSERAIREVIYRSRRRINDNATVTLAKLHNATVAKIADCLPDESMYKLVWISALWCMGFHLVKACLLDKGVLVYKRSTSAAELSRLDLSGLQDFPFIQDILRLLDNFDVRPTLSISSDVLEPLAAALVSAGTVDREENNRRDFHSSLGNLLEALPFLFGSDEALRYSFPIPGTEFWCTFRFLANHGFGAFMFAHSVTGGRDALERGHFHSCLNVDFDGTISVTSHSWMSLERVLGKEDGQRVAHWLLEQIQTRVIEDYLRVAADRPVPVAAISGAESRAAGLPSTTAEVAADLSIDVARYGSWTRELQQVKDEPHELEGESGASDRAEHGGAGFVLPQVRRSRFFKVLRACGVQIAQGKGSEIKLLRGAAHPFRLGNHYGPNPSVPTFLAVQVLKRLEITREEWVAALATCRV